MNTRFQSGKRHSIVLLLITSILLAFPGCNQRSSRGAGDLETNFMNPPESAKPRVWWHWMNGNVTKDGIQNGVDAPY